MGPMYIQVNIPIGPMLRRYGGAANAGSYILQDDARSTLIVADLENEESNRSLNSSLLLSYWQ